MKQLILTQGIPASGKTTWAKKQLEKSPNKYKRINRDSLRLMLDGEQFNPKREKFITKVQHELILSAFNSGFHVIVDDTNLNPKTINSMKELVKGLNVKIVYQDFTDVPLETCIERDLKRPNSVGEKVIKKFYYNYVKRAEKENKIEYDPTLPDCIICDLDGTLCKMVSRGPYEWLKCDEDEVNDAVLNILNKYKEAEDSPASAHTSIILMSGRDGIAKEKTIGWLKKHNIEYDNLYMRAEGDQRNDVIVKKEMYKEHIEGKYNVNFCLDDRDRIVKLWRDIGLTCMQVSEGDF